MIQINPDKQITTSDISGGGESLDTTLSTINTNISNLTTEVGKKITGTGIANNLTTTTTGYALDATQGKSLKDSLDTLTTTVNGKITGTGIANNLTTTSSGYALDARQGKALNDTITPVLISIHGWGSSNVTRLTGYLVKIGNFCTITGYWEGSCTNNQDIMTVPQAYRPKNNLANVGSGTCALDSSSGKLWPAEYTLYSGGSFRQAWNTSAATSGSFTLTYNLN